MAESINVIVVGAGFGGLAAAIELTRKGCEVKVFEAVKRLDNKGDVIMVGSNATRIMKKWGPVLSGVSELAAQPNAMRIQDQDGKILLEQPMPTDYEGYPNFYTNRGCTQKSMYEYAVLQGVEFVFDARISDFFETETSAGVVLNGEKYEADFVIAADGVHSNARTVVTKNSEKPQKSGFAVYRSWFQLERLRGNPKTEWIAASDSDLLLVWIGKDTHAIITTNTKMKSLTCFATHKDDSDTEESWNLPGKIEDMLAAVEGWDPVLLEVIKQIPPEVLIDWKLLWRNPVKQWISEGGRLALVGDAAHPHLATSGTGGAQAIEDGATIGALIDINGKTNIPLALKVYEKLRFERTALTQRMGWETRHRWHQTDWEMIASNPEFLKLPQPAWLNGADAEQYAYDNFQAAKANLESGTPFKSTNIPEDHVHVDWTIEDMMAREGEQVGADFYQVRNS
ncbi:FAD/NAD(P)-binding domain-containing protein [Cadophora sp. DSE1049]|nr:FAD/NAD(P)-binding domain-containing protein [Cadophora sp. DSE1049]